MTPSRLNNLVRAAHLGDSERRNSSAPRISALIINADDWGRDTETTDKTLQCFRCGTVSAVSAMVFMKDAERAATISREQKIAVGLHLNLTMPFFALSCPADLLEHQRKLVVFLTRHPLARIIFHPGLVRSFEYVVKAQLDEFQRLYGTSPDRIDGHHHMHLCANVVLGRLLPAGTLVRRNFSFQAGEKSLANRLFRRAEDGWLVRRHRIVDFLFSLPPLEPRGRLDRIRSLARRSVVEVETHPVNAAEYKFLTEGEAIRWAGDVPIAAHFAVVGHDRAGALGERP
jgi:hypothetical protein